MWNFPLFTEAPSTSQLASSRAFFSHLKWLSSSVYSARVDLPITLAQFSNPHLLPKNHEHLHLWQLRPCPIERVIPVCRCQMGCSFSYWRPVSFWKIFAPSMCSTIENSSLVNGLRPVRTAKFTSVFFPDNIVVLTSPGIHWHFFEFYNFKHLIGVQNRKLHLHNE